MSIKANLKNILTSIVIAIFVVMCGVVVCNAETIDSGECGAQGDNVTWALTGTNSDLALTISGTGKMMDYDEQILPWEAYRHRIKSVVIENGVTSIGNGSFKALTKLTDMTIANSVESIGHEAFMECISLESAEMPTSVLYIGWRVFAECDNLEKVIVPAENIKKMGGVYKGLYSIGTFEDWNKLKSAGPIGSNSNLEFGWKETIPNYAFHGCDVIEDIVLPNELKTIGAYAFKDCRELELIDLPNSLTTINESAFSGCISLKSIVFPSGLEIINRAAFNNCSELSSIEIPYGVTTVGRMAFSGCTGISSLTIPGTVGALDDSTITNCNLKTAGPIGSGSDYEFGWTESIPKYAFSCYQLESVTIPEGVTSIGSSAFYSCMNLKHIELPGSLKTIGDYAFGYCKSLESIVFPEGVESVGRTLFVYCSNLDYVRIPSTCKTFTGYDNPNSIGPFEKWSGLVTAGPVGSNSNLEFAWREEIPYKAFLQCKSLISVNIPNGISTIESGTFTDCDKLMRVYIPSTVTTVKGGAFGNFTPAQVYSGASEQPDDWNTWNNQIIENTIFNVSPASFEAIETLCPTGHPWEATYTTDKDSNCDEVGFKSIHCSICDCKKEGTTIEIPKKAHEYGDLRYTQEPTCTKQGKGEMECKNCGYIHAYPYSIKALGHNWEFDYTIDSESTCTEDGSKSVHCTRCDATKYNEIIEKHHEWEPDYTIDSEATCIEDGHKSIHCANCDAVKESEIIQAKGHDWDSNPTVDKKATCTTDGSQSVHCKLCDETKEQSVIHATGHQWNVPTYTWSNNNRTVTAERVCDNDGEHKETETVATTEKVTKAATYTAKGQTTYTATFKNSDFDTQFKTLTNIAQIPKKANPITVKAKKPAVKFVKLKKKAQTITAKNAFAVTKAKGRVTYKKVGGNKKITINSAGKITLKKGLKKGTYKVKVKVTAAGNTAYKAGAKTVTLSIKVK